MNEAKSFQVIMVLVVIGQDKTEQFKQATRQELSSCSEESVAKSYDHCRQSKKA
jgi:hypothetical protein